MGFFSYTCAKTNLPILASTSWDEKYSRVVMLDAKGTVFHGSYDGYGNIIGDCGEIELEYDSVESGKIKLVLEKFYNGERFEALPKSGWDPGQGHFHDPDEIDKWYAQGGFPSHKDMVKAYRSKPTEPATEPDEETHDDPL